jgi:methionyl-tRNA formyltransferase
MNIGFMGRSKLLSNVISAISSDPEHTVSFIWTSKAEAFYDCDERRFQELAESCGCPFYQSPHVDEVQDRIDFDSLDVILSANFINIISESFLKRVKHGVLNVHAGDLPRYQGNACPNWAILNGEPEVVLSVHQMSKELDSGPVYAKSRHELQDDVYITDIYQWLERVTPDLFFEALQKIMDGISPDPMPDVRPLRTFPRKPQDARVDWKDGVEAIHRLIRASSHPFDGAFCTLNDDPDRLVSIFRAEPVELAYDISAMDGQVLGVQGDFILVSSGNRALLLTEFSLDGLSQHESRVGISSSLRNRLT